MPMLRLIVLTGLATEAKTRLTHYLAQALSDAEGCLTLLDNHDYPIRIEGIPTVRLPPGCACCSVAGALVQALRQVKTDLVLLTVSAQANPATLDLVLDRMCGPDWDIIKLALIDERTRARQPFIAARLTDAADYVIDEACDDALLLDYLRRH